LLDGSTAREIQDLLLIDHRQRGRFARVACSTASTSIDGHRASQLGIGGRIAALLQLSGSVVGRNSFFYYAKAL
jgi:hypothetical protein